MTTYAGLILDFGGVVTTDFYGALAAFGVRSGLDAGAFVRVLRENPEGRGLDELFDAVVISDRVGLRKPDPEIFKLTASKIGLAAGQCLFVDDTEGNLRGARDLGMGTVFFTGADGEVAEIERLIGLSAA
jgi:putative hydrolase of the HAD superfamily